MLIWALAIGCKNDQAAEAEPSPCPVGEVFAEGICVSEEECGSDPWGETGPDAAGAIYVDDSCQECGDGTADSPFPTVTEALGVASAGSTVVVAAGTYRESLELGLQHGGVRIVGRCRDLVTVDASDGGDDARGIHAELGRSEAVVEIEGLTVTGAPRRGLEIDSGGVHATRVNLVANTRAGVHLEWEDASVVLDLVRIDGTLADPSEGFGSGLYVSGGATATVTRSEITGSAADGVYAEGDGTTVLLDEVVVRATPGTGRIGILSTTGSRVEATGSTVEDIPGAGLYVEDAWLSWASGWIRGNAWDESNEFGPAGAVVEDAGELVIDHSAVESNHVRGLLAYDAGTRLTVTESTISGTTPTASGELGIGIGVDYEAHAGLRNTRIVANTMCGLCMNEGGTVTAENVRLEDQVSRPDGFYGRGADVKSGARLKMVGGGFRRNIDLALFVTGEGSMAQLSGVSISETQPRPDGAGGHGISCTEGGYLEARDVDVFDSRGTGILVSGVGDSGTPSTATLHDTRVDGTVNGDSEDGVGIQVQYGAHLSVHGSTVSGSEAAGIVASDDTVVDLRHVTVSATGPGPRSGWGRGVTAQHGAQLDAAELTVEDTVGVGVYVSDSGTSANLDGLSIRGTTQRAEGDMGWGLSVNDSAALAVTDARIENSEVFGIIALGELLSPRETTLALQDTTVSGVSPDGEYGTGVLVMRGASLTSNGLVVEDVPQVGVAVVEAGATATLTDTSITRVRALAPDFPSAGILAVRAGGITVTDVQVSDVQGNGVFSESTTGTLTGGAFSGITAGLWDLWAVGVVAFTDTALEVSDTTISGVEGPGLLSSFSADLVCERCSIAGTAFADAVVVGGGLSLLDSELAGGVDGTVGIYAEAPADEPTALTVEGTRIGGVRLAGAWLDGPGAFLLSGNVFDIDPDTTFENYLHPNSIYAHATTARGESTGLYIAGNTFGGAAGPAVLVDHGSATFDATNSFPSTDAVVQQGCDAGISAVAGLQDGVAADICPEADGRVFELDWCACFEDTTAELGIDEADDDVSEAEEDE